MFRIKRLYSFVLKTFLPLLLATFSVCLFVLLMQFLWKYIDDMVGKGVELKVLGQLFFYAANQLVPMALPIAILLASLMTFGNLGECFELLAMKSAGISLLRIMKPLIILLIFISGIAFVFQNNVLPGVQVKLVTILYSLRIKTPELDIPERTFYKDIPGYNIYVYQKTKTGLLRDLRIYDYSKGFGDLTVTVADSGRMRMSDDKKYLILTLYNGEAFQNLDMNKTRSNQNQNQTSFQRLTFSVREVLIEFDSNFNMADESITKDREFRKNIPELLSFIHTASAEEDSVAQVIRPTLVSQVYTSTFKQERSYPKSNPAARADSLPITDFALYYKSLPVSQQLQVVENAKMKIERLTNDFNARMNSQSDNQRRIRGHLIELHRKFTYSLACLLFFFIGAPLGAIIRKGGLGLPAVLSVFIFILYYTIDTFGWKMARQDSWPVWEGMWLSSFALAALGAYLTYKAVNDSVVMNPDALKENLLRLFGKREIRNYAQKEVIMDFPDYPNAIRLMENWNEEASVYFKRKQKIPFYVSFWKQDFQDCELKRLLALMDQWIEDLLNSNENLIIGKLMDYPVISFYHLPFLNQPAVRWSCSVILPVGVLMYGIFLLKQKQINNDLRTTIKVNEDIVKELRNLKLDCADNPEK